MTLLQTTSPVTEPRRPSVAFGVAVDDEGGHNRTAFFILAGDDGPDIDIGDMRVGDEAFAAIQDPHAILQFAGAFLAHEVGAAARFGDGESADFFAGAQVRQITFLLVFVAVIEDGGNAEVVSHQGDAQTGRMPGDFFQYDCPLGHTKSGAAVFFGNKHAAQTEFAHHRPQLNRAVVVFIPFFGFWRDFRLDEFAHRFSQHVLFFSELKKLHSFLPPNISYFLDHTTQQIKVGRLDNAVHNHFSKNIYTVCNAGRLPPTSQTV